MAHKSTGLYLGIEVSSQQVKCLVLNSNLEVEMEDFVTFDTELANYGTTGGFHISDNVVTAPVLMWLEAIDIVLDKMKTRGLAFDKICAISGSGQQHGSVYWRKGAEKLLSNLNPDVSLKDGLKDAFSVQNCPVWMDSSTGKYCERLESSVGGAEALAGLTGSRAYERFTGNQIAKIATESNAAYRNTERISLVSSFTCSLLIGCYAPIDYSDGSGMNILDIRSKTWNKECADACAPDLIAKLGDPVTTKTVVGDVSPYMAKRFGFKENCKVVAFSGDNPSSVAGMRLKRDSMIVSLGTSDTVFLWVDDPNPQLVGHVCVNPVDDSAYMALLCYKNGSLTRERIRNERSQSCWEKFGDSLMTSQPGNNGNIGMFYDQTEITPKVTGVYRFNALTQEAMKFDNDTEIRALIEGQFIAKRVHAERLGFQTGNGPVYATGGASNNHCILQVLSDVFNTPVFTQNVANSAVLGAAYMAMYGTSETALTFDDVTGKAGSFKCVATPRPEFTGIYDVLCKRYAKLEDDIVKRVSTKV